MTAYEKPSLGFALSVQRSSIYLRNCFRRAKCARECQCCRLASAFSSAAYHMVLGLQLLHQSWSLDCCRIMEFHPSALAKNGWCCWMAASKITRDHSCFGAGRGRRCSDAVHMSCVRAAYVPQQPFAFMSVLEDTGDLSTLPLFVMTLYFHVLSKL